MKQKKVAIFKWPISPHLAHLLSPRSVRGPEQTFNGLFATKTNWSSKKVHTHTHTSSGPKTRRLFSGCSSRVFFLSRPNKHTTCTNYVAAQAKLWPPQNWTLAALMRMLSQVFFFLKAKLIVVFESLKFQMVLVNVKISSNIVCNLRLQRNGLHNFWRIPYPLQCKSRYTATNYFEISEMAAVVRASAVRSLNIILDHMKKKKEGKKICETKFHHQLHISSPWPLVLSDSRKEF